MVGSRRFHAGARLCAYIDLGQRGNSVDGQRAFCAGRRAPAGCSGLRSNYHEQCDQEALEDGGGGAVVNGVRNTNPGRFSRIRGAW